MEEGPPQPPDESIPAATGLAMALSAGHEKPSSYPADGEQEFWSPVG